MAIAIKSVNKALADLRKEKLSIHGNIAVAVLEVYVKQQQKQKDDKDH